MTTRGQAPSTPQDDARVARALTALLADGVPEPPRTRGLAAAVERRARALRARRQWAAAGAALVAVAAVSLGASGLHRGGASVAVPVGQPTVRTTQGTTQGTTDQRPTPTGPYLVIAPTVLPTAGGTVRLAVVNPTDEATGPLALCPRLLRQADQGWSPIEGQPCPKQPPRNAAPHAATAVTWFVVTPTQPGSYRVAIGDLTADLLVTDEEQGAVEPVLDGPTRYQLVMPSVLQAGRMARFWVGPGADAPASDTPVQAYESTVTLWADGAVVERLDGATWTQALTLPTTDPLPLPRQAPSAPSVFGAGFGVEMPGLPVGTYRLTRQSLDPSGNTTPISALFWVVDTL